MPPSRRVEANGVTRLVAAPRPRPVRITASAFPWPKRAYIGRFKSRASLSADGVELVYPRVHESEMVNACPIFHFDSRFQSPGLVLFSG